VACERPNRQIQLSGFENSDAFAWQQRQSIHPLTSAEEVVEPSHERSSFEQKRGRAHTKRPAQGISLVFDTGQSTVFYPSQIPEAQLS
jgi:hypothetical protein